jgi:hypothetical protein
MTRLVRLSLLGFVLVAAGCRTCDDRPRAFGRLRDALDRDDDREPLRERMENRHAAAPRMADPCVPCSTGAMPYSGHVLGGSSAGVIGAPIMPSGTTWPNYPSGPGTVLPPPGTYLPRDNELPAPGGYSQPGAVDMGRIAPKPSNTLTGR